MQALHPGNGSLLFAAGVMLLAIHPVLWLLGTWIDPAYDSYGLLVALLVGGLVLWSLTSPRAAEINIHNSRRRALVLLALTAAIRLAGQLLGVNVIGALALVVDVYALGLLLGSNERRRPLAPAWLAVLFAFALPGERIVQRTVGFGLQQLSAAGACQVLSLGPDPVRCEGLRIWLAGRDVLVDLPCSGARGLLLLLMLFTALATLIRPTPRRALWGLGIALLAAWIANVARITMLALGLAYPDALGGIAVMEAPWHEGIGLTALVLGATPIIVWAGTTAGQSVYVRRSAAPGATFPAIAAWAPLLPVFNRHTHLTGLIFVIAAAAIISLPAHPVDVARRLELPALPAVIGGFLAQPGALSAQERIYFTRYGGAAARADYGPYALLLVSTSAPLRHLHAPDECLAGAGQRVRYLGAHYLPLPTALYRSRDPQGRTWRVAVTFVSDRGELAASVAEVVWRWLQAPGGTWTMIQRIAPWEFPEPDLDAWDTALARALELPAPAADVMVRQLFRPSPQETLP